MLFAKTFTYELVQILFEPGKIFQTCFSNIICIAQTVISLILIWYNFGNSLKTSWKRCLYYKSDTRLT